VITRAVGTEPTVEVETMTVEAAPGDLYLICSDGLTDIVRDSDIVDVILAADADPDAAAEELVATANRNGGIDNITVVLFEIVEGEAPPAPVEAAAPEPEPAASPEPDEDTLEQALAAPPAAEPVPVVRHGAGPGGRWFALGAILVAVAAAAFLVWWSLKR
jgi:protein phosphatase